MWKEHPNWMRSRSRKTVSSQSGFYVMVWKLNILGKEVLFKEQISHFFLKINLCYILSS